MQQACTQGFAPAGTRRSPRVAPTLPRQQIARMLLPRDLPAQLAHDGYVGPGDERDAPGLAMAVLSASKVRRYSPGIDDVCISIHGRHDEPTALQPGWAAVLRVACDDTGPYAPTGQDAQSLTLDQATAILQFVRAHLGRRRLVLHCVAGVSRSRSVAAAVAEIFGLPYVWTALNDDVGRAIHAAALAEHHRP